MAARAPTAPRGRRLYIKGIGAVAEKSGGAFVFKSPPRYRKKTLTDAQRYATGTMAMAAWFVNLATAWEIEQAKEIARGSALTWKDVLISQFFGTAIEFTDENGVLWQGRRILAAEIQPLLDSIAFTPGSILVRTANGWAALLAGAPGYNMTIDPATQMPNWLPAPNVQSGSDILAMCPSGTFAADTNGAATVGMPYNGLKNIRLKSLWWNISTVTAGWTYRAFIANINVAGTLLSVAALSPDSYTSTNVGLQEKEFTFPSEPTLVAGSLYALCLVRTDGSGTAPTNCGKFSPSGTGLVAGLPANYAYASVNWGATVRTFRWSSNSIAPANVAKATQSTDVPFFQARIAFA
jgi:hypothetical protein